MTCKPDAQCWRQAGFCGRQGWSPTLAAGSSSAPRCQWVGRREWAPRTLLVGGCHRGPARNLSYVEALVTLGGPGSGALFFLDGGSELAKYSRGDRRRRLAEMHMRGHRRGVDADGGSVAQFLALLQRRPTARLLVAQDELPSRYARLALCRNALLAEARSRLDVDGHLLTIDVDQQPLSPPALVLATVAAMAPGSRLAPWAALTMSSTPWYRDSLALKTLGSLVPEEADAVDRAQRRSAVRQADGRLSTSLPLVLLQRTVAATLGGEKGNGGGASLLCNCTVDPSHGVCMGCLEWRRGVVCGRYLEDSCKRERLGPIVTTGTYTSPPLAVDSAYNGMGIYSIRHLRSAPSCAYEGSIMTAMWPHTILCEHVSFHRCLRRRGLLIGIAPWLLSEYPPPPCSPRLPAVACRRRRKERSRHVIEARAAAANDASRKGLAWVHQDQRNRVLTGTRETAPRSGSRFFAR